MELLERVHVPLGPVYTIQPVVKLVVKRFDNRWYHVYKHSTGCQTCLSTGLITGWMIQLKIHQSQPKIYTLF